MILDPRVDRFFPYVDLNSQIREIANAIASLRFLDPCFPPFLENLSLSLSLTIRELSRDVLLLVRSYHRHRRRSRNPARREPLFLFLVTLGFTQILGR